MRISTSQIAWTGSLISALLLNSCVAPNSIRSSIASAQISRPDGVPIGTANLSRSDNNLTLSVSAAGLQAGEKALHLHMTGSCLPPDFKSAGGHLNPYGKAHGMHNPQGKHLGDLPNIFVTADGTGTASITIEGDADEILAKIIDADGTAIVIHTGPDDYSTDPAGEAGARIACGVLTAH